MSSSQMHCFEKGEVGTKNYDMNAKYTNRMIAVIAMADAAGFDVVDRPMRQIEPKTDKICMLPGCNNKRWGNYLYCCAAHCKEHQQMKKAERKNKRKN